MDVKCFLVFIPLYNIRKVYLCKWYMLATYVFIIKCKLFFILRRLTKYNIM